MQIVSFITSLVIPEWMKTLLISISGSLLTLFIQRHIRNTDKKKNIGLYVKFVGSKNNQHYCEYTKNSNGKLSLHVPLWIDIVNNSDISKICRDINLYFYKNGKEIDQFLQCSLIEKKNKNGNEEKIYYGDRGMYSVVVRENTILRFEGEFFKEQSDLNKDFDAIYLGYIDGFNCVHRKKLIDVLNAWDSNSLLFKTNFWYNLTGRNK